MPLPLRRGQTHFGLRNLAAWQRISGWPFLLTLPAGRLGHMDRNKFPPELSLQWGMGNHSDSWRSATLQGKWNKNPGNRSKGWFLLTVKATKLHSVVASPGSVIRFHPKSKLEPGWMRFPSLGPADAFSELQPLLTLELKSSSFLHPLISPSALHNRLA